jgi:hypothetical protein
MIGRHSTKETEHDGARKASRIVEPKSSPNEFFEPRNTQNTRKIQTLPSESRWEFACFAYFAVLSLFYIGMVFEFPHFSRFLLMFTFVGRGFALNLRIAEMGGLTWAGFVHCAHGIARQNHNATDAQGGSKWNLQAIKPGYDQGKCAMPPLPPIKSRQNIEDGRQHKSCCPLLLVILVAGWRNRPAWQTNSPP